MRPLEIMWRWLASVHHQHHHGLHRAISSTQAKILFAKRFFSYETGSQWTLLIVTISHETDEPISITLKLIICGSIYHSWKGRSHEIELHIHTSNYRYINGVAKEQTGLDYVNVNSWVYTLLHEHTLRRIALLIYRLTSKASCYFCRTSHALVCQVGSH